METRYPALRLVCVLLKILVVLCALIDLLFAAGLLFNGKLMFSLLALVAGLLVAVFGWASIETFYIVMDVEENIRRGAVALEKSVNHSSSQAA